MELQMSDGSNETEINYSLPSNQIIYVEGANGGTLSYGVFTFNLLQQIYGIDDNPEKNEVIIACRIAIPEERFLGLAIWMAEMAEFIKDTKKKKIAQAEGSK